MKLFCIVTVLLYRVLVSMLFWIRNPILWHTLFYNNICAPPDVTYIRHEDSQDLGLLWCIGGLLLCQLVIALNYGLVFSWVATFVYSTSLLMYVFV